MLGKQKCRILKEIRQKIADENDIPYITSECHYQGECRGTCPKCEKELRYLEEQLAARSALGRKVAVAALCAGITLTSAGCAAEDAARGILQSLGSPAATSAPSETPEIFVTEGEVAYPQDPEPTEEQLEGYISNQDKQTPDWQELSGDIPCEPETNG